MNSDSLGDLLLKIDSYIEKLFMPPDHTLKAVLYRSHEAGLPEIQVSPNEGRLLQLLAQIVGAKRILEVGTLGGYSAIHLARALPDDGALISLELDPHYAEVARENIAEAGLEDIVEVRVGDARELLSSMVEEGEEPFNLAFIDADKASYPEYLEWTLRLSRLGSLILADNTIRGGGVVEPEDEIARAVHEFNRRLAHDPRLSAIILPLIRERVDG